MHLLRQEGSLLYSYTYVYTELTYDYADLFYNFEPVFFFFLIIFKKIYYTVFLIINIKVFQINWYINIVKLIVNYI